MAMRAACEGREVLSSVGERPEESVRDESEVRGCLSQIFRQYGKTQKHRQPCMMFSEICKGVHTPPVWRMRQAALPVGRLEVESGTAESEGGRKHTSWSIPGSKLDNTREAQRALIDCKTMKGSKDRSLSGGREGEVRQLQGKYIIA